jgi:DNA helicase-2/ATP-dependent DNA helicase PcrA
MMAVEQGLLPHERSQQDDKELEEERRLTFVGMTRAKQELHLTHARVREFRGTSLYAVPSMFLEELPADAVEVIDLSASAAGTPRAIDEWRGGGKAAEAGWADAGITPRRESTGTASGEDSSPYAVGMLVRHPTYGPGRITDVSGFGAMCKVKVRFSTLGEKTFIAEKAKLEIVRKEKSG